MILVYNVKNMPTNETTSPVVQELKLALLSFQPYTEVEVVATYIPSQDHLSFDSVQILQSQKRITYHIKYCLVRGSCNYSLPDEKMFQMKQLCSTP